MQFSVTSHPVVPPGASFVINVWAHLSTQREEVARRAGEASGESEPFRATKGPVRVRRGAVLSLQLEMDTLTVKEPQDTILWEGEIANASFTVQVPKKATLGPRAGSVTIYAAGLRIARVDFEIRVGEASTTAVRLQAEETRPHSAFASYANSDRNAVLARIQGIQKVAPDMDIFLDVLKLRSGQYWEEELRKEILLRDIFYRKCCK